MKSTEVLGLKHEAGDGCKFGRGPESKKREIALALDANKRKRKRKKSGHKGLVLDDSAADSVTSVVSMQGCG